MRILLDYTVYLFVRFKAEPFVLLEPEDGSGHDQEGQDYQHDRGYAPSAHLVHLYMYCRVADPDTVSK